MIIKKRRKNMKKTNLIFILGCVLFSILICPSESWAGFLSNSPNVPPLDGQYVSPQEWHAYYGMGVYIKDVIHSGFTNSFPPPPPGGSDTHSFGSQVHGMVSIDDGNTYNPFYADANVTVRIDSGIDSGNVRDFDTEMLQLNAS